MATGRQRCKICCNAGVITLSLNLGVSVFNFADFRNLVKDSFAFWYCLFLKDNFFCALTSFFANCAFA